MKSKKLLLPFVAALMLLQACGKDQDLDDYKKSRLDKNLAQIQAIQGTYSGYVKAKSDERVLGALQLNLKASTKVTDSTDESKASASPVLIVEVEFQGVTHMEVVAPNSYFDPSSGTFQANISIQQVGSSGGTSTTGQSGGGVSYQVNISGVVQNNIITGTMEAVGYSDFGGTFQLSTNGGSIDALAQATKIAPDTMFSQMVYTGDTHFVTGEDKTTNMIMLKPPTTSDQDFLTLLLPVKPVQVMLNYGNGAHLQFMSGTWDQVVGKVTGQVTLSRTVSAGDIQNVILSLHCKNIFKASDAPDCQVSTSASGNDIASLSLKPTQSTNTEPPDDSSATRDAVTHTYKGKALLQGKWIPASIAATFPARTRMDEITDLYFPSSEDTLQVSFNFTGYELGISFPVTKWDNNKKTLDSTETLSVDNQSATLTMSCRDFIFDNTKTYSFTCNYFSSTTTSNVQFKFDSTTK